MTQPQPPLPQPLFPMAPMLPRPRVTFGQAVSAGFRKTLNVSSRASRREFWWFVLFCYAVFFALMLLISVSEVFGALALLSYFVTLIPLFTAGIRRLHDIGRSGHWVWIGILPLGSFVLVALWTLPSQPHANRFGP